LLLTEAVPGAAENPAAFPLFLLERAVTKRFRGPQKILQHPPLFYYSQRTVVVTKTVPWRLVGGCPHTAPPNPYARLG
jgi:hypothetical protein